MKRPADSKTDITIGGCLQMFAYNVPLGLGGLLGMSPINSYIENCTLKPSEDFLECLPLIS